MPKIDPKVLKRLRLAKRLSLDELATRANIDKQTIHRLEKGSNDKTREHTIQQLSRALGVEPAVLTGEKLWADQEEDRSYFLMSKLGFRISTSTHNAMHLAAERYHVKYADIVELAPFLFCWAAEASLQRRRDQLRQASATMDAAQSPGDILPLAANCLENALQNAINQSQIGGKIFSPQNWLKNNASVQGETLVAGTIAGMLPGFPNGTQLLNLMRVPAGDLSTRWQAE